MAFGYYSPIPTDHTKAGSVDSTDFAVGFVQTDVRFKTVANGGHVQNASGFDLRPYDSSGVTARPFELVSYNATTGAVELYWKQPTLSVSVDGTDRLYYGDSGLSTDGSSTATWNSNHKLVWHLPNGTTLSANDSTSNGKNGTLVNAPTAGAGQLGGCGVFNAASAQSITHTAISFAGTFSASFWALRPTAVTGTRAVIGAGTGPAGFRTFSPGASPLVAIRVLVGGSSDQTHADGPNNQWNFYKVTRDSSNVVRYSLNGGAFAALYSSAAQSGNFTPDTLAADVNGENWTGSIDEYRLSSAQDSIDWTIAEYNNGFAPTTFVVLGTEVALGGGASRRRIRIIS